MAEIHFVTEAEIVDYMTKNKCDRQEAEFWFIDHYAEVVFPDEEADINDKLKAQKKIANVYDKKKGKRKVKRKPDEDKRNIIAILKSAVMETFHNAEVTNPERQIDLKYNGEDYSITLTKHKKVKNG